MQFVLHTASHAGQTNGGKCLEMQLVDSEEEGKNDVTAARSWE